VSNAPTEEQFTKTLSQITAKAWSDPAFKKRLMADPAAVAKEFGMPLPAGMQIKVIEDSTTVRHFVLPPRPPVEELSDEQLDHVAGGAMVTSNCVAQAPLVCVTWNPPPPSCGSCW
jgi:hypothetical protein